MKVIDMLNKIANGEEVRFEILDNDEIRDNIFEVENGHLRNSTCGKWLEIKVNHDTWESISSYFLNKEVEIIWEDKKIEKIPYQFSLDYIYCNINETAKEEINKTINDIYDKINEIIDYLNKEEE